MVIADINDEAGRKALAEMQGEGWRSAFIKADVALEADADKTVKFAVETFDSIDILVNNAGIYPTIPIMQLEVAEFDRIIDVNLQSAFFFTKAAAKEMISSGKGGKIINITSIDALHPSAVGLAVYDASKHGLWGLTKNSALGLAPQNIQVNAIAPGGIATPGTGAGKPPTKEIKEILEKFMLKIPMKRLGDSDEIGKVALFLASDLSSYMTGSQVVVDGGVLLA